MNEVSPHILLDTDIGGDCDDAGALALLNILALRGEAELLAVTSATSRRWAPACIAAVNRYYGAGDVPIGMMETPGFLDGPGEDIYAEKTARRFGLAQSPPEVEGAVRLMRRTLAAAREKIRIAAIGPLRNLSRLMDSPPDEFSPLDGMALLQEKVERVAVMGGVLNSPPPGTQQIYTREYNILGDIQAAQRFIHGCPVPVTFIDFYLGEDVKTGGRLTAAGDMSHPITFIYTVHGSPRRSSWDPITVLYAVRGLDGCWAESAPGRVTVTNDGRTIFTPLPDGRHCYLQSLLPSEAVAERIDQLLDFHPSAVAQAVRSS
ncbi:MAG TPA: nucleoside hydrolase [Firmicutes bacterium]|nr:nucleoside hydrolase [Bacillota bacterium]